MFKNKNNIKLHKREIGEIKQGLQKLNVQLGNRLFNKLSPEDGTYLLQNLVSKLSNWREHINSYDEYDRARIIHYFESDLKKIDKSVLIIEDKLEKKIKKIDPKISKQDDASASDETGVEQDIQEQKEVPIDEDVQSNGISYSKEDSESTNEYQDHLPVQNEQPLTAPPEKAKDPVGFVRGFRESMEVKRTIDSIFRMLTFTPNISGYSDHKVLITWSFALDVCDDNEQRLYSIPIMMKGGELSGVIGDGDFVKAYGLWKKGETLVVEQLDNFTTQERIKCSGSAKRL